MEEKTNKNWKLFKGCFLTLIIGTGLLTIRSAQIWDFSLTSYFIVWTLSCIGDFSLGFVGNGFSDPSIYIWGIPNLIALFAHPMKPNKFTGVITILAFLMWLLTGLGGAYSGV